MRWFGATPFGPMCDAGERVATPSGQSCLWCEEPIAAEDNGVVLPHIDTDGVTLRGHHLACHIRQVSGGINHLLGDCHCCGGTEPPDPPELSRREAAKIATAFFLRIP